MIPRSYVEAVRVQRAVRRFGILAGLLLSVGCIVFAGLKWKIALEMPRLAALRAATEKAEAARKHQDVLREQMAVLDQRADILAALRGAGDVERAADAIDAALGAGVWFQGLRFAREERVLTAGAAVIPASPQPGGSNSLGSIRVLTVALDGSGKPSTTEKTVWALSRTVDITGKVVDHAALTAFLLNMGRQPALTDVRFLKSSVHSGEGANNIDFKVSAAMRQVHRYAP